MVMARVRVRVRYVFETNSILVMVRVRSEFVFEPLMTMGIEPREGTFLCQILAR